MGSKQSLLSKEEIEEYEALTFLNSKEIIAVLNRFYGLAQFFSENRKRKLSDLKLRREQVVLIEELRNNPFRESVVHVFSSYPDGSMSFEDFLDMFSVFSTKAPKSVKAAYAFKIYQGISRGYDRTSNIDEAIDIEDVKTIIRKLSDNGFSNDALTKIAEAVIQEVDLRDEKKIKSEIFQYFISNIPDFESLFVIPLGNGESDLNPRESQLLRNDNNRYRNLT